MNLTKEADKVAPDGPGIRMVFSPAIDMNRLVPVNKVALLQQSEQAFRKVLRGCYIEWPSLGESSPRV